MGNFMETPITEIPDAIKDGKVTIGVYGLGWMGLPTACLFVDAGARVVGVDVDPKVIETVQGGNAPIDEPNLQGLVSKAVRSDRFSVTTNLRKAASVCDALILIVPTTVTSAKRPDYSAINKACKEIGLGMRRGSLVILESTVGPGVTEGVANASLERSSGFKAGLDYGLAYSPIRAMAGRSLRDIRDYPRIVGGIDDTSLALAATVLASIVKGGIVKVQGLKTAETVKLFENIYRDVNIALANELALLCERLDLNFKELREAANSQPHAHLHIPGIGVGGHCIPYNPYFLLAEAEAVGVDLRLVRSARKINDAMPVHVSKLVTRALRRCRKSLKRSTIAILGVSYRANVKEATNSPTIAVVRRLLKRGSRVRVYDPFFSAREIEAFNCPAVDSLERAIGGADCLVIAVPHDTFRQIRLEDVARFLKQPACIVDAWRVFDAREVESHHLVYVGLGIGR